jgi:hypothetical protein
MKAKMNKTRVFEIIRDIIAILAGVCAIITYVKNQTLKEYIADEPIRYIALNMNEKINNYYEIKFDPKPLSTLSSMEDSVSNDEICDFMKQQDLVMNSYNNVCKLVELAGKGTGLSFETSVQLLQSDNELINSTKSYLMSLIGVYASNDKVTLPDELIGKINNFMELYNQSQEILGNQKPMLEKIVFDASNGSITVQEAKKRASDLVINYYRSDFTKGYYQSLGDVLVSIKRWFAMEVNRP